MFRESLSLVLRSTFPIRVHQAVADGEALNAACRDAAVDAVLLEVEGVPWDVSALVSSIHGPAPEATVVGTFRSDRPHQQSVPGVHLVARTAPVRTFAAILQGHAGDDVPDGTTSASGSIRGHDSLTRREVQVLALISGGSTASQIADRLGISVKTVENRKQALFAKLGVQNQSHAVAVAMRTGLLGSAPAGAEVG
jgi:DNA-binding NarL/FixJ family response regulator